MSLYQVNGRTLDISFHAGQLRAWDSTRRVVAVVAGTQGGKTCFLPLWLWREITLRGPGDYGFVSPNFTLMELKALPEFRRLFEEVLALGTYAASPVRRFTVSPEGELRLFGARQESPTRVYFGHAESPDSLESATFKAVAADEAGQKAFKRESYEAIMRRLAVHRGRLCVGTTPYFSGGWLKSEVFDRAKAGDPDVELVQFPSVANPAFPREEYERARATLPAWKFALFYKGELARPAGQIYDCFDAAKHTCPRFALPADWPRFLGLDFGNVHTAAMFYAEEPGTRKLYAYREYKAKQGRTVKEHAKALLAGEPMVPRCYGGSHQEEGWRDAFRAAGLPVREPKAVGADSVEVGITAVYACHKRDEIVVFDDLREYLDEKEGYSRELDDAGEPTEKIEAKASYHLMDSERYIIGSVRPPGPHKRVIFMA